MVKKCNCQTSSCCATFVLVNGGNKSIAAKRYVYGIIQNSGERASPFNGERTC